MSTIALKLPSNYAIMEADEMTYVTGGEARWTNGFWDRTGVISNIAAAAVFFGSMSGKAFTAAAAAAPTVAGSIAAAAGGVGAMCAAAYQTALTACASAWHGAGRDFYFSNVGFAGVAFFTRVSA